MARFEIDQREVHAQKPVYEKQKLSLEIFIYFFTNSDPNLNPNSNPYFKSKPQSQPKLLNSNPKTRKMKNTQMNIPYFRFILFKLKIFDEIVTPYFRFILFKLKIFDEIVTPL